MRCGRVYATGILVGLVVIVGGLAPVSGQAPQILIRAKHLYTAGTPAVIENGQVLIEGTKIKAVGTNLAADSAAVVYSAETVMPGLIDTHTHIALNRGGGGARAPVATTAEHRTLDQFRPDDPSLRKIVEGGMTTIVTRGSGGGQVFLSQTLAVKLKNAPLEEMILKPFADMKLYVRAGVGPSFLTLMGWRALARAEMVKGQEYLQRWADFEKGVTTEKPQRDARLEAYGVLLRRESPIHVHTNYPAEIQMVMDFAKEFNLRLTLGHGNYSYRLASEIKEAGVIPVVGPTYIVQYYDEQTPQNGPKILAEAGVDVALQMDMSGEHNKCFLEIGSLLIRHGMREEDAVRALTINGAKVILQEKRIGSLEAGKDADVVLLDGPPFELTTYVTHTFIDGKLEFELKKKPQTAQLTTIGALKPFVSRASAASDKVAIVNATLFPISSAPMTGGTVLVKAGKIEAVGSNVAVPRDYPLIDAGGRVVMPGMVAARAYPVFVWVPWWGNTAGTDLMDERTRPVTADVDPRYNIDPSMPNWKIMRELGLTTYLITPGNANVIGGKGIVVRGMGNSFDEMVRDPEPKAMVFSIGETPRLQWGDKHLDDGGIIVMLREALNRAKSYKARRDRGEPIARNVEAEALVPVLERKELAIFACDRERDLRAAMQLGDEYGLRMAISGGIDAYKVIDEIKKRDIPVILGSSGTGWTSFEGIRGGPGFDEQLAGKLSRAGIKVAIFGPGGHRGNLPIGRLGGEPALNAAWCFKNGMSEADALKMITLNGADVAGVGNRLGSLDVGKIADIVIMNGHPLTYRALPEMVLMDGKVVYQRAAARKPATTTAEP